MQEEHHCGYDENEDCVVLYQPGDDWDDALKRIHEYELVYYAETIPHCLAELRWAERMVALDAYALGHRHHFSDQYMQFVARDNEYWRHVMWDLRRWLANLLKDQARLLR